MDSGVNSSVKMEEVARLVGEQTRIEEEIKGLSESDPVRLALEDRLHEIKMKLKRANGSISPPTDPRFKKASKTDLASTPV